ncbi:ABC transporter permease [Coraliomargarita sp. SDUM461003]|uniref:ABC transporter permease n=2 Tax=Thalassobacterium TaxID=3410851 RepID=A0ABU1AX85_9BACT|nr:MULTISPECIES: ABC transporter permease [unclassified Coraliomargarita]MDQ8193414.1 ABC transporter permease [Coraliomargarita sp. SDUM461004]MDQ8208770.1 ABC transporter permease [Coraliomargarita sp. SDUM461003]
MATTSKKIQSALLPIASGIIILAIWNLISYLYGRSVGYDVQRIIIPFPHQIATALWSEREALWLSTRQTALSAVIGFIAAVTVGYILSMLLASAVWVKKALYPWILVLQMTPVVVLAPIFVLWMGQGLPSITAITFMIGFFPVVANTTMGLVSTDRNLLDLFEMSNASKAQEIMYLRVPFAMPYFLTGMKIAGTLAPIGAIAGDLFAGSSQGGVGGIGYMVILYNSQLKIPELFATALVACMLGFVFVGCVNWLHWYLLKDWHESARKTDNT